MQETALTKGGARCEWYEIDAAAEIEPANHIVIGFGIPVLRHFLNVGLEDRLESPHPAQEILLIRDDAVNQTIRQVRRLSRSRQLSADQKKHAKKGSHKKLNRPSGR